MLANKSLTQRVILLFCKLPFGKKWFVKQALDMLLPEIISESMLWIGALGGEKYLGKQALDRCFAGEKLFVKQALDKLLPDNLSESMFCMVPQLKINDS